MGCGSSSEAAPPQDQNKTRALKRKINWSEINAKLVTDRSEESKQKRFEMFRQFDPNGNGYLSLAEVDKGLRDVLQVDDIYDTKPVIMRAFQASKGLNPPGHSKHGSDYIEKNEFRMLLVYLKQFMAIWEVFAKADDSDDRRLNKDEFSKVWPQLQKYAPGKSLDECWNEVNGEGNLILFTEFAQWAIETNLKDNVENPEDE